MHQARTYLVETLDWEGRLANVVPVEVDYYTRSSVGSNIRKIEPLEEDVVDDLLRGHGNLLVVTKASGFRKIKRYTHETLGFGEIDLPEMELDTDGFWLVFGEELTERMIEAGILVRPNEYGPNWSEQRRLALERDDYRCRTCGAEARPGNGLHIHHLRPFREYGYVPGKNDAYRQANDIENLVTLCPSCHRRAELSQGTRSALGGLAYVLSNLAPLFLMCAPQDIQVNSETRSPVTQLPTIVIYERTAAGVGFSQRLFELHDQLLSSALELVSDCRCKDGCPACVGPPTDIGPDTKNVTLQLLTVLNSRQRGKESHEMNKWIEEVKPG
jgi:DEAD/DEAH box helicase domain-containing protein